jgi:hypothetical protein
VELKLNFNFEFPWLYGNESTGDYYFPISSLTMNLGFIEFMNCAGKLTRKEVVYTRKGPMGNLKSQLGYVLCNYGTSLTWRVKLSTEACLTY